VRQPAERRSQGAGAALAELADLKVILLGNATLVDGDLRALPDLANQFLKELRYLAPEHGLWGEYGPGEHVPDGLDLRSGRPVLSLHGPRYAPEPQQLRGADLLLIGFSDAGARAYTYLSSMLACLKVAAEVGLPVGILDRPSPLGRAFEGGGLPEEEWNIVAPYDLPLRHGLSPWEIAWLYASERGLPVPARVPLGEPPCWVAPSPNLPTKEAALAFTGNVLLEGTNLSEGRGTTRPFTVLGAPWLDGWRLAEELAGEDGLQARPLYFFPRFSKHQSQRCCGIELHITDPERYRPVRVALNILAHARRYPDFEVKPGLRRLGGSQLSAWLEGERPEPASLLETWAPQEERYRRRIQPLLS
jgi:uncharacterized protein YbbC (DUF1343 family)